MSRKQTLVVAYKDMTVEQRKEYYRAHYQRTKEQRNARTKELRKQPERKAQFQAYHKRAHLQKRYGITLEQKQTLFVTQGSCCAICKNTTTVKEWCIDHCHLTGIIRGVLCHYCNTLLGNAKDNVVTL